MRTTATLTPVEDDAGPASPGPRHAWPDSLASSWVVALALGLIAVHWRAARAAGGSWWGADAYRFLPAQVLPLAFAVLVGVLVVAWRGGGTAGGAAPRVRPWHAAAALTLAGILFWTFRARHVLLGDGIPISNLLPDTSGPHPREPLASGLQHVLYRTLGPTFATPGVPRAQVVRACVAAGSVAAGVLFLPVALGCARELVRAFPARTREHTGRLVGALTLTLVGQGYVQVFFGYVEHYAFPVMLGALFIWTGLRFLRGAGALALPLAVAVLAVAFDFTALALGPAALVLVWIGVRRTASRRSALRDLALVAGVAAVVVAGLRWSPLHYDLVGNVGAMLASGRGDPAYLLSRAHVRDFFNEHLLVGPFGLWLFVPMGVIALGAWGRDRHAASAFLLVAGTSMSAACWVATDLPMGYARDWDLFCPLAVVLAGSALGVTLSVLRDGPARWRALAVLAAVSAFHTVPWVALNASEARSLERFKTLPLGGGRTENTVAYWYAEHGDLPQARRWLDRSLAVEPENPRALDLYGRIALDEHRPRLAVRAYVIAVSLRPDKDDLRRQLAVAVNAAGGADAGLSVLDSLAAGRDDHATLWLVRAMLLHAAGRDAEADAARGRAIGLLPLLASAPDRMPELPPKKAGR